MHAVMSIPLSQVDCNKKPAINTKTLRFAILLSVGVKFPPISVRANGERFTLTAGRHRYMAHKLAGKKEILATVAVRQEPDPFKRLVCSDRPRCLTSRPDRKMHGLTAIAKE